VSGERIWYLYCKRGGPIGGGGVWGGGGASLPSVNWVEKRSERNAVFFF